MRIVIIALCLFILILTGSFTAAAAPLVMAGRGDNKALPPLEKEDLKLMRKTVRKSLNGKKAGESATWKGEKSGNSGKVTFLGDKTTPLGECRHIEHTIKIKDETHERKMKGFSCEVKDGKWKFVSEKEMSRMNKKKKS